MSETQEPTIPEQIETMERRLYKIGLSPTAFLKLVGVGHTGWQRWKSGQMTPRASTWAKVVRGYHKAMDAAKKHPEGIERLGR